MKYVVLYTSADDVASRAPAHFPAHKRRLDEFHARGELLLVGAFGDPQREGSMAIFRTRESAEEFVAEDPFVMNGVVSAYEIRDWNEILAP
ncbi:YciI family protein [Dactylosporangium sp. NPDC048998]|uniref:YciI family protein n=1 Tax=Dactylosporangium sp. NPDC048998 TaxID=3363976 RepID=UPI003722AAD5